MLKKLSILVLISFFVCSSFLSLNAQWAITYGATESDYLWSLQQTTDGGFIIAGDTYSFGAGDCNFWILKLSPDRDIEWEKIYGGSDYDSARFIQQTIDGGYIVAGYTDSFGAGSSDYWVLKLGSDGSVQWQKTYGGSDEDGANHVCQTSDGGYIVAGGSYSFGAGSDDAWILKLSSTGTIEWQKTYGGSEIDSARGVQQTVDGGYIITGCTESFSLGYYDVWVLKLSSTGEIEWQKSYGGPHGDSNLSAQPFIQQTADGGYIATAYNWSFSTGYSDFWVFKLSSDGSIEWQNSYGSWSDYDTPYFIQQTADGGYVVTGFTYSFGAGEDDVWVLKLNSTGTIEWQKTYGGIDYDYARVIQQTTDGGYIVGACTWSFGAGRADVLLLKLYPNGDIALSCDLVGSSTVSAIASDAYPVDSYATPGNTYIVPSNTTTIPQDTAASVSLLCEAAKYSLTISTSVGGTTDPEPGAREFYENTEVDIIAIPDSDDFRFSGWTGDVPTDHEEDNPISIIIDSDKSITANFIRQYTLTIAAGTGGTTNPSPGTYTHDSGANVSIQAAPNSGYNFTGWSGDATGTTSSVTITMDSDKSVTANFEAEPEPPTPDDGDEGGGCFIATAAYGSLLHPHVKTLRDFRDKYLVSNRFGREFVDLYYKYSPFIADLIAKKKSLRVIFQINLTPFVVLCYSMVHLGPIVTGGLLILVLLFPISSFFRRA